MTTPVFVLAGQSNVGFLSSEIEQAFDDEYGLGNYELIRVFDAGAPLTRERENQLDWSNPDELREDLTVETINALLADDDRVFGGMIWVQGEADTFFAGGADRYGETLDELIDGFRDDVSTAMGDIDVGMNTANVTILELSENAPDAPDRVGWDTVIAEQREVADADPTVQTLDPDTVAQDADVAASDMFRDGLHYEDDFGAILADELVQTLAFSPPEVGDDGDGSPVPPFPTLPVTDEGPPLDDMQADGAEEDGDDGGFGFEAILFLLPLLPLLGMVG
ncbi:sialate O-acetylesterase [uncultured Tateyamaria sp.]|uniref:sialate O-acetylesterase n=1 Tax=uncultured Tateyamaria sp. TaxID=455651 RepID=UPI00261AA0FA|nr:sialate O-acetylesterase [uncultured Tateyamaria sp.]